MSEVQKILDEELGKRFGLNVYRNPKDFKTFHDSDEVDEIIDWFFVRHYNGGALGEGPYDKRRWIIRVTIDGESWGLGPAKPAG